MATTKLLSEQNQLNRIAKHQINFPLALTLSGERKHMLQSAKTTKQQARITQQEKRSENNRIVLLPKDAKKQKQHRKNAQDKGNEPTTRKHPQNINAQAQNTPVAQKNIGEAILTRPNMFVNNCFVGKKCFLKKKRFPGATISTNHFSKPLPGSQSDTYV